MRRQELAVGAKLPQSGGDEQRNVRPAVVAAIVDLGVVAPRSQVVGQLQTQRLLYLIGAEVRVLSLQARPALGLEIVLLQGQADGVLELGPALLAGEGVVAVVPCKADLAKAYLAGHTPDVVREVFTGHRRSGRLDVAGDESGLVHRLHARVYDLAELGEVVRLRYPRPLSVGGLIDGLGFKRVLSAVESNVHRVLRDAGDGGEVLGDRDFYVRLSVSSARSLYRMTQGFGHLTPPSATVERVYASLGCETIRTRV